MNRIHCKQLCNNMFTMVCVSGRISRNSNEFLGGKAMSSKQQVLALLEQYKGTYISGEEIARQMQITRAAVWRTIHDLRLAGHAIEASTKVGYRLSESSDVLSLQGIRSAFVDASCHELPLYFHESIGSTNTEAKRLALEGTPHGTMVVAGCQTEGRGRNGRFFFSPNDSGLYVSVVLRPDLGTAMALRITSGAAVAVCRAIERVCDRQAGIKWVNDVYIDGLKVCGILTEGISGFETGRIESLVVGIGVNHTLPPEGFPDDLHGIAGAVFPDSVPPGASRNRLAAAIIEELLTVVDHVDEVGFMVEYRRRSVVVGQRVKVLQGTVAYEAEAIGIADDGALVVRLADGSEQQLRAGEISLRPILGSSW